jgi:hypothetical protein
MIRFELVNDPHFQALDEIANRTRHRGQIGDIRRLLVDWLKACEEKQTEADPFLSQCVQQQRDWLINKANWKSPPGMAEAFNNTPDPVAKNVYIDPPFGLHGADAPVSWWQKIRHFFRGQNG